MVSIIQTNIDPGVIRYLENNKHLLVPDVSNYAKGRYRAWIGAEAPLTDKQKFKPGQFGYDTPLWRWLHGFCNKHLSFDPEVGLVHIGGANCGNPEDSPTDGRGGECGITSHRDAGYADYRAVGINICGEAVFGYASCYQSQDSWTKPVQANVQLVKMIPGTCVVFNCKNPHFAQVGPNRWCINAWRISKRRRDEYKDYMK